MTDDGRRKRPTGIASQCTAFRRSVVRPLLRPFVSASPGRTFASSSASRSEPVRSVPIDRPSVLGVGRLATRFACADDAGDARRTYVRSTDRRTDGPTDPRTRKRERASRRIESNRNHTTHHRKEPQHRLCVCVPSIHSVSSRVRQRKRKEETPRVIDRDRTFGATVRRTVFFAVVARLVSGMRPVFKARATMIIFVRAWIGVRGDSGRPTGARLRFVSFPCEIFNSRYTMGWCLSRTQSQILKRTTPRGCEIPHNMMIDRGPFLTRLF